MGYYINPGNDNFKEILQDDYLDKTGLISVINDTIGKVNRLSCVSRPRRFGKSYAANMLAAYYDCSCDSHELFEGREIAQVSSYEEHLNQYNVLYLDITGFMADATISGLPKYISERVLRDIFRSFSEISEGDSLKEALSSVAAATGKKFVAIIDEWDAPIRSLNSTLDTQLEYMEFLRSLFKSEITKKVFAAAYMTGILPIKKDGAQSAISEFYEYSILDPGEFAPYTGFTVEDVRKVCNEKNVSFELMRDWYNGYNLYKEDGEKISMYNPNSVMRASKKGKYKSYWGQSSAVYGALDYINLDFEGLGEDVERLKESVPLWYNDEQALRAIIKLAFFTYRDHYIKLEELPSGTGYVDMAYIPKKYDPSPPLIIELKAGGSPEEAMEQIRSRHYTSSIEGMGDGLVLVAITYEKGDKTKQHHCRIEHL